MKTENLYYYESGLECSLIVAPDLKTAEEEALKIVGTFNGVQTIRLATTEDVNFIASMGGYVPSVPVTVSKEKQNE